MNYARIYQQLIDRANKRDKCPPREKIERHHIVPRCLNGSDHCNNIALLTVREHYIAHLLLCKIHPEYPDLVFAVAAFFEFSRTNKLTKKMPRYIRKRAHLRKVRIGQQNTKMLNNLVK